MDPVIENGGSGGGFQRVTSKLTGVLKNSLFYFIQDNRTTGLAVLKPYQIEVGKKPGREVVYLKPKAKAAAAAATSPDATSFRGIAETERHISVDLKFSQSSAPGSRGFSPAHLTVSYGPLLTLHVYFDRHGKMLNHHVKSVADGTYLDLTPAENAQIRREAAPIEAFLQTLITEKQQAYKALEEQLTQKEQYLSALVLSQNRVKAEYIKTAHECLALTEQLNRYSDTQELRNKALIEARIARFQEAQAVPAPAVVPVLKKAAAAEAPEAASVSDETTPKSATQKTIIVADRKAALEALVKKLNTQHAAGKPLSVLLGLFFEVETLALEVIFESKGKGVAKNKKFVREKKATLPFDLQKLEAEFVQKLAEGNLDYVKDAYPHLVGVIPMGTIFNDFIRNLRDACSDDVFHRKMAVADYLYEATETYRSLFLTTLRHIKVTYPPLPKVTVGYLAEFFLRKNWVGFQAMLERYGDLHDKDQLFCTENNAALNMIQTILFFYENNPDIRFLDTLLTHGMPLVHTRDNKNRNVIYDVEVQGDALVKKGVRRAEADARADTVEMETMLYGLISLMEEENQALKTSLMANFLKRPEFAARLIAHTDDIDSVLQAFMIHTNSATVGSLFVPEIFNIVGTPHYVLKVDYRFKVLDKSLSAEEAGNHLMIAEQLRDKFQSLFQALSVDTQRDFMLRMKKNAEQKTGGDAFELCICAQIAYAMMTDRSAADHKVMDDLYSISVKLKAAVLSPQSAQIALQWANHFRETLKQKDELEAKAVALHAPGLAQLSVFSTSGGTAAAESPEPRSRSVSPELID